MKKVICTCFPAMVLLAFITTPSIACPDLSLGDSWESVSGGTWILSTSSGSSGSGALTAGYSNAIKKWSLFSLITDCDVTIGSSISDSSFSANLSSGIFAFPAESIYIDNGSIAKVGSIYHLSGTGRVAANNLPVNFYGDFVWEHLQGDVFKVSPDLTLWGTVQEIGLEVVPLPGTLLMLGTGLLGLLYVRRRFQRF